MLTVAATDRVISNTAQQHEGKVYFTQIKAFAPSAAGGGRMVYYHFETAQPGCGLGQGAVRRCSPLDEARYSPPIWSNLGYNSAHRGVLAGAVSCALNRCCVLLLPSYSESRRRGAGRACCSTARRDACLC